MLKSIFLKFNFENMLKNCFKVGIEPNFWNLIKRDSRLEEH